MAWKDKCVELKIVEQTCLWKLCLQQYYDCLSYHDNNFLITIDQTIDQTICSALTKRSASLGKIKKF